MKKILIALNIAIWSLVAFEVAYAAEKQKVCIDKIGKDGKIVLDKSGKPEQDCKMMVVHKKLEATTVPDKKK